VQLVSNDQMRDHHYLMLAPRALLQWRERHQVNFRFRVVPAAEAEAEVAQRAAAAVTPATALRLPPGAAMRPEFSFPRSYSHRIQASEDGRAWHFPVEGTESNWLAVWRVDGEPCEPPAGAPQQAAATSALS